ncbi:MAG TPA: E3 binding domain-containing protein [Planctomycetota bacterium]|nr:E3 binding domain-containing protein [Planctomycetota bacterium]
MELIRLPKVAENITEGTVSRWLVAPDARVAREQPIVELITEKAEFEMPSPAAGRLAAVYAPERSTVPVGYVLCALAEEGEALPDVEALNAEIVARHQAELLGTAPTPIAQPSPPPTASSHQPATGARVAASPAARRLAKEKGVDLATVAARLGLTRPVSEEDVKGFLGL